MSKEPIRRDTLTRAEIQAQLHHEQALNVVYQQRKMQFFHGFADSFGQSVARWRNKTAEWDDYLVLIRFLPEILLYRYGFEQCVCHTDQIAVYDGTMKWYRSLSEWLRYLNPGDKEIPAELLFSDEVRVKPRAELSKVVLDLAVQLLPRSAELQQDFKTPADLWFAWEASILDADFFVSGLATGNASEEIRHSNTDSYKVMQHTARWLESANSIRASKDHHVSLPLSEALLGISALTASKDETFRFSKAYQAFQRELKRWGRTIRNTPGFNQTVFRNGQLLPSGKKAPRKAKKVGKGFGV
ncbi:MAG: hypothetical protein J0L70_23210 [Leptolyngbya sp. UWPOB_LEPTO1]|uniref:hypothetical protein n=1 Tax=Leptolyngbya sp. UWPOB_LEPTO1 TaxID=2815653 RepID=UPI001AD24EE6|nr:hypothetical protein [Leptolyngbya sp. UWPOB_LEPTO1]MBN8563450.1 hypothetical protein [Leptolyngbya sp. UWPOB_LEPTO1]